MKQTYDATIERLAVQHTKSLPDDVKEKARLLVKQILTHARDIAIPMSYERINPNSAGEMNFDPSSFRYHFENYTQQLLELVKHVVARPYAMQALELLKTKNDLVGTFAFAEVVAEPPEAYSDLELAMQNAERGAERELQGRAKRARQVAEILDKADASPRHYVSKNRYSGRPPHPSTDS